MKGTIMNTEINWEDVVEWCEYVFIDLLNKEETSHEYN